MSAVLRLPLQHPRSTKGQILNWKNSAPFVINSRGMLVHRPRTVQVYECIPPSHIAIHFYCGMTTTGRRELTFTDALPDDAIVCHRCEMIAVEKNHLPTSSFIVGRHVHVGGVRAYTICCKESLSVEGGNQR